MHLLMLLEVSLINLLDLSAKDEQATS